MGKSRLIALSIGSLGALAAAALATACTSVLGVTELREAPGNDAAVSDSTMPSPEGAAESDAARDGEALADGPGEATDGGGTPAPDGGDSGAAGLTVTPAAAHLERGSTFELTVTMSPPPTGAGVAVTASGLPSGVSIATPLTLTAAASQGTLTLSAAQTAALGPAAVTVSAGGASAPLSLVVADSSATLDTTFNQGGVQAFVPTGGTTGSVAHAVVALADGSVVLGGCAMGGGDSGWALAKLTPAGTVDNAFAANVAAWNPHLSTTGCLRALAVSAQGTIVAGGDDDGPGDNEALVRAFNGDGTVHQAFEGSGSWQLGATGNSNGTSASGVAWEPSGEVDVAINPMTPGGYPPDPFVARIEVAGGQMQTVLASTATLYGISVDPQGHPVTGGQYGSKGFYAVRLSPSGIDPAFGNDGGPIGPASAELYAATAAVDTEGGIYLAGAGTSTGQEPVIGHVNAAGRVDLGDAGWVGLTMNVPENLGFAGLVVQTDGNVLGVGNGSSSTNTFPWLVRTTAAGVLDSTFNGNGVARMTSAAGVAYYAVAVFPPPDGRIVVVGTEPGMGFYAARFWP
jgi:uncharacterized delta-60 repeat protein